MSDTVVDSKVFGTVFVTEGAYDKLNATGESVKTETYLYAFRLEGKTTCDDVKDALEDIKVDTDSIDDEYFQEYWDRTGAAINDFKDGIRILSQVQMSLQMDLENSLITTGSSTMRHRSCLTHTLNRRHHLSQRMVWIQSSQRIITMTR